MRYNTTIMENQIIQPRVLKGFRDALPQEQIFRSDLIEKITGVYRSYGFVPIDTPVLEYTEILLRKSNGETEKQVFRFEDNGGRDVAMRFDLTVPFARFTAEHKAELAFPFKRYHIAKVWRGEKPQAGRYREFVQCDIDTVGSDSAVCDAEILCAMKAALAAIGIEKIKIHINHRGAFNRFLAALGVQDKSEDILRSVDKLAKVGKDAVMAELVEATKSDEAAKKILEYIEPSATFEEAIKKMESLCGGAGDDTERMRQVYQMLEAAGIASSFVLDPSITRGLDYYTGLVYESFLDDLPSIGSVCSGGRYDNLAGLYTKERIPGVGGSIGLDRLMAAMEQLGIAGKKGSYLDAEIFCQDESLLIEAQKAAAALRSLGVKVEVFPEAKKMGQQYALAEAKSVLWGVFVSADGKISVKNLKTREQSDGLDPASAAKMILAARS